MHITIGKSSLYDSRHYDLISRLPTTLIMACLDSPHYETITIIDKAALLLHPPIPLASSHFEDPEKPQNAAVCPRYALLQPSSHTNNFFTPLRVYFGRM